MTSRTPCPTCGSRGDEGHWAVWPWEEEAFDRLLREGAEWWWYSCRTDGSCSGHRQIACPECGRLFTEVGFDPS